MNLLIYFDDQLLVVVERSQRLSECEQVLWAIVTLKRKYFRVKPGACSQAVAATSCRSLAPMTMSHSMIASSPNMTGNAAFHTLA